VNALNSTSAGSGGLIIVRLPMALVDLNTFAMHFESVVSDGRISEPVEGADPGFHGILPKGIEGLISRLEVSVNGLGLLNLQQYNLLFSLLKESHLHLDKTLSRTQLQNEKDMVPLLASGTSAPVFIQPGSGTQFTAGVAGMTTSSEIIPIHVSNWYINNAPGTAYANIICTTTTSEPIPCTINGVYELKYAPTAAFFGLVPSGSAGSTALAQAPQIILINSTAVAYPITKGGTPATYVTQFTLQYQVGSGTWSSYAGTGQTGVAQNLPSTTGPTATPSSSQFTIFASVVQSPNPITGVVPKPFLVPNNNNFHTIHDWLAFFKAQPEWVQTQMLGEVEVRITLAGNDVLGISHPQIPYTDNLQTQGWNSTALPDYSLQNIFFSIRTCSFDNNFVDDMLHSKLSSGGEIEIPYDNYFNINQVQSGGSSQTRFSVNTQSLNKVLGVNRVANFNQWYNNLCAVPSGMGATSQDRLAMVHKNPYFCTTASNPSGATYGMGSQPTTNFWQYQINNAFIPNYKINPVNNFFFNQEMYDMHNDWASGQCATTPSVYLNSGYQMGVSLDFMDSEIPRLVSGVDTRGAVSVAYLNQDNNNSNDRTDIFTCFTSILRVGANQQIQVVY